MATVKTQGTTITCNALTEGEVNSISLSSNPVAEIAIPSFAETVMMYRPGRRKTGDLTIDYNLNPDNTTLVSMDADRLAGTERTVVIVAPEGTLDTITFTALIMDNSLSAKDDDVYKGKLVLKVTSNPVRS
jgi:hypothetical protein